MRQKFMRLCNNSGVLPTTGNTPFCFVVSFILFVIFSYFWLKITKKITDFHALSLYHKKQKRQNLLKRKRVNFVVSFILFVIFSYFWLKITKKITDFHALSLYHKKQKRQNLLKRKRVNVNFSAFL